MRSLLLIFALVSACSGAGPSKDTAANGDDTAHRDTSTPIETGSDSGARDSGDTSDTMEPGDPVFHAVFGGQDWVGEPGYWSTTGGLSTFMAQQNDGEIKVTITVTGDVRVPGSYPIESVQYSKAIPQAGFEYYYQGSGDGSQAIEVSAHDADTKYLWASYTGTLELTDTSGTGDSTTTFDSLTIESWPKFGAR